METILDVIKANSTILSERDIEFIEAINEEKDFIEIANMNKITPERVRQITKRLLKRLPDCLSKINEKLIEIRKKEHELKIRENAIMEREKELKIDSGKEIEKIYPDCFYLNIDELLISKRLLNVLKCFYVDGQYKKIETMAQLADILITDSYALMRQRNCGKKTMNEIERLLKDNGIEL